MCDPAFGKQLCFLTATSPNAALGLAELLLFFSCFLKTDRNIESMILFLSVCRSVSMLSHQDNSYNSEQYKCKC